MFFSAVAAVVAPFSLALLTVCSSVYADPRIATVNVGRILNESPDALSKKKELDSFSQDAKKKADAKRKELQALETKLKDAKVSEDSKEAENFRNQAREYERFVKDAEEDIKQRYIKVNKDITEKAILRIEEYAKTNKVDLVLDKSEKFHGPVLFGAQTADITDEILKSLGGVK